MAIGGDLAARSRGGGNAGQPDRAPHEPIHAEDVLDILTAVEESRHELRDVHRASAAKPDHRVGPGLPRHRERVRELGEGRFSGKVVPECDVPALRAQCGGQRLAKRQRRGRGDDEYRSRAAAIQILGAPGQRAGTETQGSDVIDPEKLAFLCLH